MNSSKVGLLLLLVVVSLSSCRKREFNDSIQSAQENARIETEFSNIYDIVSGVAESDGRTGKTDADSILPSGALLIFSDSAFVSTGNSPDGDPAEFIIDYGAFGNTVPAGVLCKDGRYRAGKIHVSMRDRFNTADNQFIITISDADGYYVGNGTDMYKVKGTETVTRIGNQKKWTTDVNDAIMQTDEGEVRWSANRTLTFLVDNPFTIWGDKYQIEGNAAGFNSDDVGYTLTITKPLLKEIRLGCASTFTQGILELKNSSSNNKLTLDYDPYENGNCDRIAKASFLNYDKIITIW
jgi:hypothetical protein